MASDDDDVVRLELVLAEILNNVVEHAQAGRPNGQIELQLTCDAAGIDCMIVDDGAAMPGDVLPQGHDTWETDDPLSLPEGGFGWYLIRQQVETLSYIRDAGRNQLAFRLAWACD